MHDLEARARLQWDATMRLSSKIPSMVAGAALAAATLFAGTPGAQATAIFTQGNNPQPDEENILFGAQAPGLTQTGTTNQSGVGVLFTSTQILQAQGIGQGFLEAVAPDTVITGDVTFSVPGFTFLDYIFNPQVGGPDAEGGPATIRAITNDGTFDQPITLDNGNNFWTITTADDEVLLSVSLILAPGTSYNQYQQPRVSGLAAIPEPASLALLGSALIGFGILRRRKRA